MELPNKNDNWTIYGNVRCSHCISAKNFLTDNNINFVYHELSNNKKEYIDFLSHITDNTRTLPLIFKNDKFIGGYDQLLIDFSINNDEDF